MEPIEFRGRTVQVPLSVEELTMDQYIYLVCLNTWLERKLIDGDYFRVRWFSWLLGLGNTDFTMLRRELIEQVQPHCRRITDGFMKAGRPDFTTCVNLIPEYKGYKGPADWMSGVSYGKFVECATVFSQLASAEDPRELYQHIARTLYSIPPEKPVPEILAWHSVVFFSNVWRAIQTAPVEINGQMLDLSIIFKGSSGRKADDKTGWTGISFEVASAGLFGNVRELEEADFWEVLIYLYKCKFEYLHDKSNKK